MKKFRDLVIGILCMSILLFFSMVSDIEAAESKNKLNKNFIIDTRPDYTIFVNRALNCISIVQQEEDGTVTPIKAMVCSCGREGHETPEGVFQTSNYYNWRLMVDGSYGRYAVRFNGKILFHSVPYTKKSPDTLEWEEYNALGENASLGCVRLSVEDAKWIYDNCKPGTTVVVYSDTEVAGLLDKPTAVKIAEDSPCKGWDPTDVDINNPWFAAVIENAFVPAPGPDAEFASALSVEPDGEFVPVPSVEPDGEFDYIQYADSYPDLKEFYGYDKDALYEHYITYGLKEGRVAIFNYTH